MAFLALAGCGGGANTPNGPVVGSPGGPNPPPANYVTAGVTVQIADSASRNAMQPAYLSKNTKSVVIALAGVGGNPAGGPASTIDTYPKASNCKHAGAFLNCTGTVKALAGKDTFNVTAFSAPDGSGQLLSSGTATAKIDGGGGGVRLGVSSSGIGGVIVKLRLDISKKIVARGKAATVPFVLTAYDASGAAIGGNSAYEAPVSVTIEGDASAAFALRGAQMTGSSMEVTGPSKDLAIVYNGDAEASSITIQAAATGSNSASAHGTLAVSGTPPPPPVGTIYVLNAGAKAGLGATVTAYDGNASGNAKPLRTLQLDAKRYARSIAVDSTGRLYVGYYATSSGVVAASGLPDPGNVVAVYAAGASGSASPISILTADTQTSSSIFPVALAFDPSGDLVTYGSTGVDGNSGDVVSIYAADASGAAAPLHAWTFDTPSLRYAGPTGLALDGSGNFYLAGKLATGLGPSYGIFVNLASHASDASSSVSRTIPADATTKLIGPFLSNLGLDAANEIVAGNYSLTGSSVLTCQGQANVFASGATGGTTDNAPLRTIVFQGASTTNSQCYLSSNPLAGFFPAVAVYGSTLFVADEFNNAVSSFATTASGTTKPASTIEGANTGISTPIGVSVSPLKSGGPR